MGLLITQRPNRGQVGKSRQPGVLAQEVDGMFSDHQEEVQGQRGRGTPRRETSVLAAQVEASEGLMDEQRPSIGD